MPFPINDTTLLQARTLEKNLRDKWPFPPAFGPLNSNRFVAGSPLGTGVFGTDTALAINVVRLVPFQGWGIIRAIGINVTAAAAGSSVRLAIFDSESSFGADTRLPGALLYESATIDTASQTGTLETPDANIGIEMGGRLLWFGYNVGVLAPTVKTVGNASIPIYGVGVALAPHHGFTKASAYGPFPSVLSGLTAASGDGVLPAILIDT